MKFSNFATEIENPDVRIRSPNQTISRSDGERERERESCLERATLPHWIHFGLLRPRRVLGGVTAEERPLLLRDGDEAAMFFTGDLTVRNLKPLFTKEKKVNYQKSLRVNKFWNRKSVFVFRSL